MKYFKYLKKGMVSPYQKFQYEADKEYKINNFDESDRGCSNGFYYLKSEQLIHWKNQELYEVEIRGRTKEFSDKNRAEYGKIIKQVPDSTLKAYLADLDTDNKVGYKYIEAMFPFNPFTEIVKPTDKHIELLKGWHSVRHSVGHLVRHSVRHSVGHLVGHSVRDSVWHSVGDSVGDSVWAYTGSLFPNIKKWKYIDHKKGVYPLQPAVDLWYAGLVPSFDGKTWRLHSGEKATIVYEIEKDKL